MQMTSEASITSWLRSSLPDQIGFLEKIVRINSHTKNIDGVNTIQSVFHDELSALGLDVTRVPIAGSGDLLIARNCGDADPAILLSGHVDTVHPVSSTFIEFRTSGDRLIGPGSLDMKGGLVIMLWALKALRNFGVLDEIPLRVVLNSEEEIGSPNSRTQLKKIAAVSSYALVFEWGRDNNSLITRRKGIRGFKIRATGKKAHSGNALAEGRNAIEAISHAVLAAQKCTDYGSGVTLSVNQIAGGTSSNTVPDEAWASCDVRSPTFGGMESIRMQLDEIAKSNPVDGTSLLIEEEAGMDPLEETASSAQLFESFRACATAVGETFSKVTAPLGGASDANIIAGCGVPTIDGLGPLGDGAHTDSEYSVLSSYTGRTASLAVWLLRNKK